MSDSNSLFGGVASYLDKLMKGAKAAGPPIEQPSRFYLSANLKTAKEISVEVPISLLPRAEVIE